jgi:hypothetical protein
MRRGLVCCACVCASLALIPLSAQAGLLAGVVRGVTAAPRAVMGGLFGGTHGRHHRHATRRESHSRAHVASREAPVSPSAARDEPQLNSWWGAVYWPTAYRDTFGYIISGANEGAAFWAHSSNDIYAGVFVPAMASTLHSDKPLGGGTACDDDERNQAISLEPIQQELHPTQAQHALLDALQGALLEARNRARVSCTTTAPPLTPTARLETMWDRLRALRQAVGLIRTPLKTLYESLSDEQKARINSLSDARAASRRGNAREPQVCADSASSRQWPAKPIEEAVRPTEQQRASLGELAGTTSHLSALLLPSCPPAMLVTPTGRLEAVVNRLDSMIYAVTLERAALNNFYASLDEDQKARFDAEIRRPPPEHDRRALP